MSDLRQFLDLHQYGQAYAGLPEFVGWMLLAWFGLLCLFVLLAWLFGKDKPLTEDEVADWNAAYVARQNAYLRRDSRAKHVADKALKDAMNARLMVGK